MTREQGKKPAGGSAVMYPPKEAQQGEAADRPQDQGEDNAPHGEARETGGEPAQAVSNTMEKEREGGRKEAAARRRPRRTVIYTLVVALYAVLAKILFFMRIEGRENIPKDRNCVLMGNHQCLLDPVTLALCVPDREIHFMGKKELFENPVLGWVFRQVHGFPVDRGNMDMAAVRTALGVLKNGDTLGIFPEGTRSRDGHMLPLLGGASLLALRSGCDVVPVYIDGRYRPFGRMVVRVGRPIETADLRAGRITKETCDVLTHRMEGAFAHLSGGKSLPAA